MAGTWQMDNCCGCGAGGTWQFLIVEIDVAIGGISNLNDAMDTASAILAAADFDEPPLPWQTWDYYPYTDCGIAAGDDAKKLFQWYGWNPYNSSYEWNDTNTEVLAKCPWPFFDNAPIGGTNIRGPAAGFIVGQIGEGVTAVKTRLLNTSPVCVSVRSGSDWVYNGSVWTLDSCERRSQAGGVVLDTVTSCPASAGAWSYECAWLDWYDGGAITCEDCECPADPSSQGGARTDADYPSTQD